MARAPLTVASFSASSAGSATGSPVADFCRKAAVRSSSNMSRSLFEQVPSVPMVTSAPAARIFSTGATPLEIFMLLCGLCDTATPRWASVRMSLSVTWMQCAPMVLSSSIPSASRCSTGVAAYFSRTMRTSSRVSAIWVMKCSPHLRASSLPRRRFSGDTV